MDNDLQDALGQAEAAGIAVTEPIEVGDLSDVKDSKPVIPATSNVKLKIRKASIKELADGNLKKLNLLVEVVDGIPQEDGSVKFRGMRFFDDDIWVWANTSVYTKEYWTSKKYLVQLKQLRQALGLDFTEITDEVLEGMCNIAFLGRIDKISVQRKDESGEYVDVPGEYKNVMRYPKAIPQEDLV